MANTITIDPANRIEGHQKWHVVGKTDPSLPNYPDSCIVDISDPSVDYKISGVMFRGFENIMPGRDPRDAIVICSRI